MGADELVADIKDPDLRERALEHLQKEKARSLDETLPAPWEWDIKRLAASQPSGWNLE
jgi:hypothetical protein